MIKILKHLSTYDFFGKKWNIKMRDRIRWFGGKELVWTIYVGIIYFAILLLIDKKDINSPEIDLIVSSGIWKAFPYVWLLLFGIQFVNGIITHFLMAFTRDEYWNRWWRIFSPFEKKWYKDNVKEIMARSWFMFTHPDIDDEFLLFKSSMKMKSGYAEEVVNEGNLYAHMHFTYKGLYDSVAEDAYKKDYASGYRRLWAKHQIQRDDKGKYYIPSDKSYRRKSVECNISDFEKMKTESEELWSMCTYKKKYKGNLLGRHCGFNVFARLKWINGVPMVCITMINISMIMLNIVSVHFDKMKNITTNNNWILINQVAIFSFLIVFAHGMIKRVLWAYTKGAYFLSYGMMKHRFPKMNIKSVMKDEFAWAHFRFTHRHFNRELNVLNDKYVVSFLVIGCNADYEGLNCEQKKLIKEYGVAKNEKGRYFSWNDKKYQKYLDSL